MKTISYMIDRSAFVAVWITIAFVSTGLASLFISAVKTIVRA